MQKRRQEKGGMRVVLVRIENEVKKKKGEEKKRKRREREEEGEEKIEKINLQGRKTRREGGTFLLL